MDILEFLQKSEWPLLVGGALWYFRHPLTRLLNEIRLTKFAAWGLSAEFEKRLDKVEDLTETTRQLADEAPSKRETPRSIDKTILGFQSDDAPPLIILRAWSLLESELRSASDKPSTRDQPWTPRRMEDAARILGMTHNEIEAMRELRKLRNQVAHSIDFSLTRADAIRFSEIADDLTVRVWQLSEKAKLR
jgi:hypothetical protein